MTTAIVVYTPPLLAIVPAAHARTRRETTFRRKPLPQQYLLPDNYEAQVDWHKHLLSRGWTPVRWEVA